MQDFVLCSPFNGFPFILNKTIDGKEAYHTWQLNFEEAMKVYWFSHICDINVYTNVYVAESGASPVNITKNFSTDCYTRFMDYFSPTAPEPYLRAINNASFNMYSFFEDGINPFWFSISSPLYQGEDSYQIKFWGNYSFDYDGYGFELHLGLSDLDTAYLQKIDFTMTILGREIPCIFVQTYGKEGEDNIVLSASASISSSYLE